MVRKPATVITLALLFCPGTSLAEDEASSWYAADQPGKWTAALSIAVTNLAVEVVDSELTFSDEIEVGDFDASLSDELSISTSVVSATVGYSVLPFLELTARAGLANSESNTGIIVSGTPTGQFSEFFDGPITLDGESDLEVDGYSLGLGAAIRLPIAEIGDDLLAGYSEFQYVWNRFDNEEIVSEGSKTTLGLAYPVNLNDRSKPLYFAGVGYSWLSREIEQNRIIAGQAVNVQITQEFENPWSIEFGAGVPISKNVVFGAGAFHQLSGETSAFASIIYRFD